MNHDNNGLGSSLKVPQRRPETHGAADVRGDDGERPVVGLRRPDGTAGGERRPVQAAPAKAEGGRERRAGMNCIQIGLPEKLILSKRKGLLEVLFS